jgi:uncharacterized protein (UPF0276 family)
MAPQGAVSAAPCTTFRTGTLTMPPSPLAPRAGIGFKPQHFAAIMADVAPPGFIEVHAENYMGAGGPPHAQLTALRARHELSLHGVGLSIGGEAPPDAAHLARLRALCDRYAPHSFSEHLAWSSHGGVHHNDLLPMPYTRATLARVAAHVAQVQEALGCRILIENPSTYLRFAGSAMPEGVFLAELCRRTGCGLLLDVANVFVSAINHGEDPVALLHAFPLDAVGEIHLAGHEATTDAVGAPLLIDTHAAPVPDPVWALYRLALRRIGPVATLIEWDNDVPDWLVLRAEAMRAQAELDVVAARSAA